MQALRQGSVPAVTQAQRAAAPTRRNPRHAPSKQYCPPAAVAQVRPLWPPTPPHPPPIHPPTYPQTHTHTAHRIACKLATEVQRGAPVAVGQRHGLTSRPPQVPVSVEYAWRPARGGRQIQTWNNDALMVRTSSQGKILRLCQVKCGSPSRGHAEGQQPCEQQICCCSRAAKQGSTTLSSAQPGPAAHQSALPWPGCRRS